MNKKIAIATTILFAIAIFDLVLLNTKTDDRHRQYGADNYQQAKRSTGLDVQSKCHGQGPVDLTVSPMRLQDIDYILPYGIMIGAHVTPIDHQYYEPADRSLGRDAYPVLAIADGFITKIEHRTNDIQERFGEVDEYRLEFEHTCTFSSYFDLVTSLSPEILEQANFSGNRSVGVRIPVKAGQVIGRIGGQTLDFAVWDYEKVLTGFVNPEQYNAEPWKIHTVDPYDYFVEPVRSQLLAKTTRTAAPRGGKIDYDIDGKIVGNWFLEGTNGYGGLSGTQDQYYWKNHLSIVYDAEIPDTIIISVGDFQGAARQFRVRGNSPDPATIGVSKTPTKYGLISQNAPGIPAGEFIGTMLVQLIDNRLLKLEIFYNQAASQVSGFTSDARRYER
jgi:hypothetical protein